MPINPRHATFYQECEICQEKFWDEDTTAYLTTREIKGELITVCRSCLKKLDAEKKVATTDEHGLYWPPRERKRIKTKRS